MLFSLLGVTVNVGFPGATGVLTLGALKVVVWTLMASLLPGREAM